MKLDSNYPLIRLKRSESTNQEDIQISKSPICQYSKYKNLLLKKGLSVDDSKPIVPLTLPKLKDNEFKDIFIKSHIQPFYSSTKTVFYLKHNSKHSRNKTINLKVTSSASSINDHLANKSSPKKQKVNSISTVITTHLSPDKKQINNIITRKNIPHVRYIDSITYTGLISHGVHKINQESRLIMKEVFNKKDISIIGLFNDEGKEENDISSLFKKHFKDYFKSIPLLENKTVEEIYQYIINKHYSFITEAFVIIEKKIISESFLFNPSKSNRSCTLIIQIGNKIISATTGKMNKAIIIETNYEVIKTISPTNEEKSEEITPKSSTSSTFLTLKNLNINSKSKKKEDNLVSSTKSIKRFNNDTNSNKPSIIEETITSNSQMIFLGSKGVWRYLTGKIIAEICKTYYRKSSEKSIDQIHKKLLDEALEYWAKHKGLNEEYRDDISCISMFLQ